MSAKEILLTINGGSSSLKFALFSAASTDLKTKVQGAVGGIGTATPTLQLWAGNGKKLVAGRCRARTPAEALHAALQLLDNQHLPSPTLAGHRLVHGGPLHTQHIRLTPRVHKDLKAAQALAPLHLPSELAKIDVLAKRYPQLPQVVCFDTAFHAAMPERARRLPLPEEMVRGGVHRYGFHGLSYEYLVHTLGARQLKRAVLAHLGNGASLAAVDHGRPVDTTMGFSPAGGVMMGTRSGDLDPGVVVHWLRRTGGNPARLEKLIYHESGLRAVSGSTGDMRVLLSTQHRDPRAKLGVQMFCYQVRQRIGALAAAMGGIDTLVFTGGIGEHSPVIRREICRELEFIGVRVDADRNRRGAPEVSPRNSNCVVRVLPTNEDEMIARHTWKLARRQAP